MALISFIEKQTLKRLFGISGGYIFKYWSDQNKYNKNITHDIILETCGIDIYNDSDFLELSQEKCFNKIIESNNLVNIANLLEGFCRYFEFAMAEYPYWNPEDEQDYSVVKSIIERLRISESVNLPEIQQYKNIEMLTQDIEHNINNNTPELVLDRLHTYSTMYLRETCDKHNLPIADDKGNKYAINILAAKLKNYYIENNFCQSEFSELAIKSMISLFEKFNDIRNSNSFAHPNDILGKAEAEYVVKSMLSTLQFIMKIEEANDIFLFEELPF
ncbi:MAG: abortive infection family protein [Oscillospiraceae bacterium]|nr:abortive infection family protein [Oscillospiraceae bacterium]